MYRSLFPRDMFAEMDRLQREMQQAFDLSPTIRGFGRSGFPALNVGSTPGAFEIYAFAPGIDPATLDVQLERNLLTIAGERKLALDDASKATVVHIHERFEGPFRRVVTLPEDADPDAVQARYRDGILRITVQRQAAAQPRRIAVN
ncbi:Hsp20/alpha crystallin family protein [Variovorax dokdonensis]|uniref:Hsp20/alpha crystallin family protein n=1 Tax=Variovorax dokdonensis TaxID=344883 RepID=A0ABT7NBR5_9BURK|nr:Hsp20/alpha crystallin family protein [Variovorax dokdonensis]MDM0045368.1 Hsp20/alpha crystallin family protein [Variovorax dokdonensis]